MDDKEISGYTYGTVAKSPIRPKQLELLKEDLSFTLEDEICLRKAGDVLSDQVENILDLWLAYAVSDSHLADYYKRPDGKLDRRYLAAARKRFGQWILDTCYRPYNQEWLNYQHEIGLRHHRTKKNKTDNVQSAPHIPLRNMIASIYPIVTKVKPFLAKKGDSPKEVEKMYQAWFKSVVMQVSLWSYPYAKEGDW